MAVKWEALEGVLSAIRAFVPPLTVARHKGQAGRIAVVGGCREYTGAPYFAAISALRLGADISHVFCSRDAAPVIKSYSPELIVHPLLHESYESMPPSLMSSLALSSSPLSALPAADRQRAVESVVGDVSQWLQRMDCAVIGPGLGRDPFLLDCVAGIIEKAREANLPLVIDADGLFLLNTRAHLVKDYPLAILTPNKVEMQRLHSSLLGDHQPTVQSSSLSSSATGDLSPLAGPVDADGRESLVQIAHSLGNATLVAKGAADVITDGRQQWVCGAFGSPRRCGGQGDILAGSMAVFMAWAHKWQREQQQQLPHASEPAGGAQASAYDVALSTNPAVLAAFAACLVVRHAAATTFTDRKRSMVTGDIISRLGDTFEVLFPTGHWESSPKL